jgi:PAS domain S-box-containing protein
VKLPRLTQRDARRLWLAVAIAITLSLYRLSGFLVQEVRQFCEPYFTTVLEQRLSDFLFFWLLVLLWLAYRRWRGAMIREEELETVLSSISPDVLITVTPSGAIAMCNSALEAMFGYRQDEVLHQATDLLYSDRRVGGRHSDLFESLRKFGFHMAHATGRRKDGELFPVEIITADLRGRAGAVELIRDITERQQLEEARNNLIDMMVHDLKAPLASIDGYLKMLIRHAGQPLDEEKLAHLRTASRLVWRQVDMIDTILDVSRLECSEMPLDRKPCDMVSLANEAVKTFAPEAGRKRIEMEDAGGGVPATCDPDVIRRVIINIVGNAVKFVSPDGQVRVRVERDGGNVKVSVMDNGPGIPAEHHEGIFDRFVQV